MGGGEFCKEPFFVTLDLSELSREMMVWWSTALQGLSVSTLGPWVILFGEAGNFELRYAFVGGSREAGL